MVIAVQVYFPGAQYDEGKVGCENCSQLLGSEGDRRNARGAMATGDAAAEANCGRSSASETLGDGGPGGALDVHYALKPGCTIMALG